MGKEEFQLGELLKVDARPERVEELMNLVEVDLPDLPDEVKAAIGAGNLRQLLREVRG